MGNTKIKSTDLFSIPSFMKGVSRTVNLFGNLDEYNYQDNADAHAIKNDWKNVGLDIKSSIKKYATTQSK